MISVLLNYFKKFRTKIDANAFQRLLIMISIIVILSAVLVMLVEPEEQFTTFSDALWWAIVTVTTVGYGDKYTVTIIGRIISIVLMIVGIGAVGAITAKLADVFIDLKRRREIGEMQSDYKNHIVVCGWSTKTKEIINQILNEDKRNKEGLVLVANIERNPFFDNQLVHFVRGEIAEEEALKKANIGEARTAIILNEDNNDATTVLAVLTIEHLNPNIYTIAEISNSENKIHLQNANVDEIVVNNEINSQLLVRSALYSGTSQVISELLSNESGNEIYMFLSKEEELGKRFLDLFIKYKEEDNLTLLGIKRGVEIITNPDNDLLVEEGDKIIYISKEKIIH